MAWFKTCFAWLQQENLINVQETAFRLRSLKRVSRREQCVWSWSIYRVKGRDLLVF